MTPPVWFLDVDGVINAIAKKGDSNVWQDWEKTEAFAEGRVWPILYSPTVINFIRTAHESGQVEVRWLTTWRHWANEELRRNLNLPEFEVAADTPTWHSWWKAAVVTQFMEDNPEKRVIWTDDDLTLYPSVFGYAKDSGALPVSPRQNVGLTPGHLRYIEAFIREEW